MTRCRNASLLLEVESRRRQPSRPPWATLALWQLYRPLAGTLIRSHVMNDDSGTETLGHPTSPRASSKASIQPSSLNQLNRAAPPRCQPAGIPIRRVDTSAATGTEHAGPTRSPRAVDRESIPSPPLRRLRALWATYRALLSNGIHLDREPSGHSPPTDCSPNRFSSSTRKPDRSDRLSDTESAISTDIQSVS